MQSVRDDLCFGRRVEKLLALGPRPLGEILLELLARWGEPFHCDLEQRLDRYGRLSPGTILDLGGDQFARPPLRQVRP